MRTSLVLLAVLLLVFCLSAPVASNSITEEVDEDLLHFFRENKVSEHIAEFEAVVGAYEPKLSAKIGDYSKSLNEILSKIPDDDTDKTKLLKTSIALVITKLELWSHKVGAKVFEGALLEDLKKPFSEAKTEATEPTPLFDHEFLSATEENIALLDQEDFSSKSEVQFKEMTDEEWVNFVVQAASTVANVINDVGTYSDKVKSVGNFMSNTVGGALDRVGLQSLGNAARSAGNGITQVANVVKPFEDKVAKVLEPVKNNQVFQVTRSALNVAATSMNIFKGAATLRNLPDTIKVLFYIHFVTIVTYSLIL